MGNVYVDKWDGFTALECDSCGSLILPGERFIADEEYAHCLNHDTPSSLEGEE